MTKKSRKITRPAGFGQKETEGYFMIANQDAARAIANKLSGTQLRLWLYLMMADSFADTTTGGEKVYHEIPSPNEIALKIGASPETVVKDIRALKKLGLYDYRVTAWEGHNLSARKARQEADRLKKQKKTPTTQSQQGGGLNNPPAGLNNPPAGLNNPPAGLNNPPAGLNNPSQAPEPLPDKPFRLSQTYTDFIQTLSDSERENFEKFVREEWKRLKGEEVINLERFLAKEKDLKNWHQRFLNSPAGKEAKKKAIATQFDWHSDPRFKSWIWEAFNRGYEWVHENEAEREQRLAFYNWAFQVNAFEGVCF